MIERAALLADLRAQVRALESDLRGHGVKDERTVAALRQEWQSAREAQRTAAGYETWLEDRVIHVAVAWALGTLFVRFCEDNGLIELPVIAGRGTRFAVARERQSAYFQQHPERTDRDWIIAGLDTLSTSPAALHLLNGLHRLMRRVEISQDAARELLSFWRRLGADGQLVHDFTDPDMNTDCLADLYQDLSEQLKKTYATVRTPGFVADFILDRTLGPALQSFGPRGLRVIDPVCGSGTFLLGAFLRLLTAWREEEPDCDTWPLIQQALASVHGVDKNPLAVAIARFRLLIAAVKAGGARRLAEVPELAIIIAAGDSLIPVGDASFGKRLPDEDLSDYADCAVNLLGAGSYHVVVGNPPYLTVRDKREHEIYQQIYDVCYRTYALTVPFAVRFFQLARAAGDNSGFVGTLASNSFMKREFGRPLVEDFLATIDLTHVIDTSGAYLPGHGTPTVILLGRSRPAKTSVIRAAIGVRSEPSQPSDPASGRVWQAIRGQLDTPGSESEWIDVVDLERDRLAKHPWSLARASTINALTRMERGTRLREHVARIGYYANTGSDDLFTAPAAAFRRIRAEAEPLVTIITGSEVRDWRVIPEARAFFPGEDAQRPVDLRQFPHHFRRLWPYRTVLGNRPNQARGPYLADGRAWYSWHHVTKSPDAHPWLITFPWVATQNHFALLREPIAALPSAPVIRLPDTAPDSEFFQLTGLLNSSIVCFWLKQYSNSKGSPRADQLRAEEPWTYIYEFTSTRLEELPLPSSLPHELGCALDELAHKLAAVEPSAVCAADVPTRAQLDAARTENEHIQGRMIALQEELDWDVYRRYGLLDDAEATALIAARESLPEVKLGERAFEIVLARRAAAGELDTQWFARHRSTPITEIPEHWPQEYRDVVARRIEVIERRRDIGLIERPEYKRRWQSEPWEKKEAAALRSWLLDRCENRALWYAADPQGREQPKPVTVSGLADRLRGDADVVSAARLLGGPDADLADILKVITAVEHVPYLAQLRHTDTGLHKRLLWEKTWDQQREEDREDKRLKIDVPPKYKRDDFLMASYWNQRGKLDVPKERFISFPQAGPDGDNSLLLGWAGWDNTEQAHALLTLIEERATDGWGAERLIPLLAGFLQVMPWVRQWDGDIDPEFESSTAREYDTYLTVQLEKHGLTEDDLRAWRPPKSRRGRPRKIR
jgi:hypothetical protein